MAWVSPPRVNTQTVSNFRIGWAAGAGVEYAFTDSITGRVEYLVAGLESASDNYSFGATVTTEFAHRIHQHRTRRTEL